MLTVQLHQLLAHCLRSFLRVVFIVNIGSSINAMLAPVFRFFSFTDEISKPVSSLEKRVDGIE